jgi:hypothetical protein
MAIIFPHRRITPVTSFSGFFQFVLSGLLAVAICSSVYAQSPRHTVSGFVHDAQTGESLIGATVSLPGAHVGTITNRYGFYSLTLPADSVAIAVSFIGYQPQVFRFRLAADTTLYVRLRPMALGLDEVVVEAERNRRIEETTRMSTIGVPVSQIQEMPALLGETDVLKALQLLPGIQSGAEGTSGLYVRGGGPDQNLILLDGVPVYNASHLFGFFSVFNADAIQRVEVVKGGFPARYGGRLSSVIEIDMKEGNMNRYAAQGGIGVVASRLTVEGPTLKDRGSFVLSGRRTYIDLLSRPFMPEDDFAGYYFYDFNAKINHIVSDRDRVYLSLYTGDDRFSHTYRYTGAETRSQFGWGNTTFALRWNRVFSNKLFGNLTLTSSNYEFSIGIDERRRNAESFAMRYASGIRDLGARVDFEYLPSPAHSIRAGLSATSQEFSPGAAHFRITGGSDDIDLRLEPVSPIGAVSVAGYFEDEVRISPRLAANVGVHGSMFSVEGQQYVSLQPRAALRYLVLPNWSVKASYATMEQYLHLLANSGIGLPTDLWVPATDRVRPQLSRQVAAGIGGSALDGALELSVEGYYKTMDNLIEYVQGAHFLNLDRDWQDLVTSGSGRSYGAELFVQRRAGRLTGWLGYTLSWTHRQFEHLNDGREFPYKYDRRHDVSTTISYDLGRRLDVSATWVYGTGNAVTLPIGRLATDHHESGFHPGGWVQEGYLYGDRNAHRMRAYHRLDLGMNWRVASRRSEHVLSMGVFNAYNRKNPFFIYFDETFDGVVAKQVSLFPAIPSLSYNFKF